MEDPVNALQRFLVLHIDPKSKHSVPHTVLMREVQTCRKSCHNIPELHIAIGLLARSQLEETTCPDEGNPESFNIILSKENLSY